MRLIKLTSNKTQFKSVEFKNSVGMNIIKASRKDKGRKVDDSKKTRNGVGKSLIINIIDFCFASEPIKEFEEKLNDWVFILFFSIGHKEYKIVRSCSNQKTIFLNDFEYEYKKIRDFLWKELFDTELSTTGISFRALLPRFIRSPEEGYTNVMKPNILKEKDYNSLLCTAWLLGLDTDFIENKFNLVNNKKEDFKKAEQINEYELSNLNLYDKKNSKSKIDLEIRDVAEKISKIESDLSKYQVAENYREIQEKANDLTNELRNIENEITFCDNSITQIDKSLKSKDDIKMVELEELFREVSFYFPENVKKTIKELEIFHSNLLLERKRRLNGEKKTYNEKIKLLDNRRLKIAKERDNYLLYLGQSKALDEYSAMQQELFDLKKDKDNLERYLKTINNKDRIKDDFNLKLSQSNIETDRYIEDNKITLIDNIVTEFRKLSSMFYKDKAGGIAIENNTKENGLRFNISITIEDDASSGISEVKMFCFDVLLLILKNHHKINFIFHDSKLFANMDPRQRLMVFKTMEKITKKHGIQYICNVNEDQLDFESDISKEEYDKLINENIILDLKDVDDSSRLLGEKIPMHIK